MKIAAALQEGAAGKPKAASVYPECKESADSSQRGTQSGMLELLGGGGVIIFLAPAMTVLIISEP